MNPVTGRPRIDARAPYSERNSSASMLAVTPGSRIDAMRARNGGVNPNSLESRMAVEREVLGPRGGQAVRQHELAQQRAPFRRVAPTSTASAPASPARGQLADGSFTAAVRPEHAGPGQLMTNGRVKPGAPMNRPRNTATTATTRSQNPLFRRVA